VALTPNRSLTPAQAKAQRDTAEEDVLLREVDEAVRQDQFAEFVRRYGRAILIAAIVALALFGGYLWWQSHKNDQREADSEVLVGSLDQIEAGNLASADAQLAKLNTAHEAGAQAAARLLRAGIALEQNKPADAAKLFDRVAADGDAPQAYRDLATIRAVTTRYDTMKPADVVARLKPLAVPGNPWFGSAGELVAMAYLDQGRNGEAGTLFAAIAKDEKAPESLRSRARQMAGLLGVDAIENVDEVLAQPGVAGGAAPPPGA
jgi:hypothetical protein